MEGHEGRLQRLREENWMEIRVNTEQLREYKMIGLLKRGQKVSWKK